MMKNRVFILLFLFIVSCGSSKGGHCDAYGKINEKREKDMVFKKENQLEKKINKC